MILGFPFTDQREILSRIRVGVVRAIDLLEIRGSYKADSLIMTFRFAGPVQAASARAANSLAGWVSSILTRTRLPEAHPQRINLEAVQRSASITCSTCFRRTQPR